MGAVIFIIGALLCVIAYLLLTRKRAVVIVSRPAPEPPPLPIAEDHWQADLIAKHSQPPWPER